MPIIQNMLCVTAGVVFWACVLLLAMTAIETKEGTLLWCKLHAKMDQPICAPFTVKDQLKLRRSQS